jgi:hypothetical protein
MRVKHLYVVCMNTGFGGMTIDDETAQSGMALFNKHGAKSEGALLVHQLGLHTHDLKQIATSGVLPDRSSPPAAAKETGSAPSLSAETIGGPSSVPGEKSESMVLPTAAFRQDVGVYVVFHADEGGWSFDPADLIAILRKLMPTDSFPKIGKIALVACDIAANFDSLDRRKFETHRGDFAQMKSVSGPINTSFMFQLVIDLADAGIRPMVAGYDVPIFVAPGVKGEILVEDYDPSVTDKRVSKWKGVEDPASIEGKKLVLGRKMGVKQTVSGKVQSKLGDNDYRVVHKRVLCVSDEGKLLIGLRGWSDKD